MHFQLLVMLSDADDGREVDYPSSGSSASGERSCSSRLSRSRRKYTVDESASGSFSDDSHGGSSEDSDF